MCDKWEFFYPSCGSSHAAVQQGLRVNNLFLIGFGGFTNLPSLMNETLHLMIYTEAKIDHFVKFISWFIKDGLITVEKNHIRLYQTRSE
jgi:hypothetical protein